MNKPAVPATSATVSRRSGQEFQLTPVQQSAFSTISQLLEATSIVVLQGGTGLGKSTLIRNIQGERGGRILALREVVNATAVRDPNGFEESFANLVNEAFASSDLVIVDDLDVIVSPSAVHNGTRRNFIKLATKMICEIARRGGHRLLFTQTPLGFALDLGIESQAALVNLQAFGIEDYAELARHYLTQAQSKSLDFNRIFRYASKLQGHQLRIACELVASDPELTTEKFLSCLDEHILESNTRISEVAKISFSDLKGAESIVEELQINILMPMENDAVAKSLGFKPKRGVLLFGPPGTGKTSIGRALAHQMKGKFFIIDGTFITEPPAAFFTRVRKVFDDAKANSPAVIFIDDADVLFKTDHVYGLNRYLLTMLDGLESETSGNVCVMMTAMNVKDMPPALLRSGRVELWLETKLPPKAVRKQILELYMKDAPKELASFDFAPLDRLTDGFTPADLRRIVGDAKALYAFDQSKDRPKVVMTDYLVRAAVSVQKLKIRIADSLGYELPKSSDLGAVESCGV